MFEDLLEAIALALDQRDVPYMVIGGQAVLVHGEPRLTRDVDVTLGVDLDRLPTILDAAASIGLTPLVDPEDFTRRTMVLPCQHAETGIRVDFIFSFTSYEQGAIRRAVRIPLGRAQVRFASAEDLIVHKVLAGRPRDLEDVRSVLVKNPALNRKLLRDALAAFQESLGEPLLMRFDTIVADLDNP